MRCYFSNLPVFRFRGWDAFNLVIAWCAGVALGVQSIGAAAAEGPDPLPKPRWHKDARGRVIVEPLPVPTALRNPWPAEWEDAFWDRANYVIRKTARSGRYGNTYFENEKRAYGYAMLSILGGHEADGLKFLQSEDAQARSWHKHTLGIDFYACFTLKHQMRKYFFFGPWLDAAYRRRMFDGARIWTERDPLRRPHHAYNPNGGGVWGPDAKNSWVDVRTTDNLELMRDCAVYLFAEETGNESTRQVYAGKLRRFITTLYRVGMSEWDSENYLGHSFAPLLCLYDFAKDREMQALAKAALDWMSAAAAVKYWRGGCNGPTRRDYNHPYPFGGSLAAIFWLYFGDTPLSPDTFESDEIHIITSAYRPPPAVVALARKQFPKPAEIIAAKPPYQVWQQAADQAKPQYFETSCFGHTYQLGTLLKGTQNPDVNGFKLLLFSSKRGVDYFVAGPVKDPLHLGSPKYESGLLKGESRVAAWRNLAIYLTRDSDIPFLWLLPAEAELETVGSVWLVRAETTWLALWPVGLQIEGVDRTLTEQVHWKNKSKQQTRWPHLKVLTSALLGAPFYGSAMEIGEAQTHGDYAHFKQAVTQRARLDTGELSRGHVELIASDGRRLGLRFDSPTVVERNGKPYDPERARWIYAPATSDDPRLIRQEIHSGRLEVDAGNWHFECRMDEKGKVAFENARR